MGLYMVFMGPRVSNWRTFPVQQLGIGLLERKDNFLREPWMKKIPNSPASQFAAMKKWNRPFIRAFTLLFLALSFRKGAVPLKLNPE